MSATPPSKRTPSPTVAPEAHAMKRQHNKVALIVTAVAVAMFVAVIALMFLIHHVEAR